MTFRHGLKYYRKDKPPPTIAPIGSVDPCELFGFPVLVRDGPIDVVVLPSLVITDITVLASCGVGSIDPKGLVFTTPSMVVSVAPPVFGVNSLHATLKMLNEHCLPLKWRRVQLQMEN